MAYYSPFTFCVISLFEDNIDSFKSLKLIYTHLVRYTDLLSLGKASKQQLACFGWKNSPGFKRKGLSFFRLSA